jgi:hypothetical protein
MSFNYEDEIKRVFDILHVQGRRIEILDLVIKDMLEREASRFFPIKKPLHIRIIERLFKVKVYSAEE